LFLPWRLAAVVLRPLDHVPGIERRPRRGRDLVGPVPEHHGQQFRIVHRVDRIAIERRRERVFQPVAGARPFEDLPVGRVNSSSRISQARACTPLSSTGPHISLEACSCPHTAGRSGCPKIVQRSWTSSCTQGTPAGLPWGMPGMGEEMVRLLEVEGKNVDCSRLAFLLTWCMLLSRSRSRRPITN
jgi:hypothetical protein